MESEWRLIAARSNLGALEVLPGVGVVYWDLIARLNPQPPPLSGLPTHLGRVVSSVAGKFLYLLGLLPSQNFATVTFLGRQTTPFPSGYSVFPD